MQKTSRFRQHAKPLAIVWTGIAIAAMLSPQAFSSSDEYCTGAWDYAPANANHSCENEELTWFHSRQKCWVRAYCLTGNGLERNYDSIHASLEDVYSLNNCGGELHVGDC